MHGIGPSRSSRLALRHRSRKAGLYFFVKCNLGVRIVLLRNITFCVALIIAMPAAWADDWKDCEQMKNWDLKVTGCTAILTKGHDRKQNLALAYMNRGIGYYDKGDYDRAIADYDKAIELNPKLAPAYNDRGNVYSAKGDYDRAIADFDKAIELTQNTPSPT